jgi:hypothetical protein
MAESPLKVEFMSGERVYKKSPEPMDGTGPKLPHYLHPYSHVLGWVVVVHTCNPSTQEAEVGGLYV